MPEVRIGGVLYRSDFLALHEMERVWDQPLQLVLDSLGRGGLHDWHRLAWCLSASYRAGLQSEIDFADLLDTLPEGIDWAAQCARMVMESVTPICPTHEPDPGAKPTVMPWSRLIFEAVHLLGMSLDEAWRSTLSVHQALLWEYSRYEDPEGKSGRPMAQWEIDAINNRNLDRLMMMGGCL